MEVTEFINRHRVIMATARAWAGTRHNITAWTAQRPSGAAWDARRADATISTKFTAMATMVFLCLGTGLFFSDGKRDENRPSLKTGLTDLFLRSFSSLFSSFLANAVKTGSKMSLTR